MAAKVLRRGQIPIIGPNAALSVVEAAGLEVEEAFKAIIDISMAPTDICDAMQCIGTLKGWKWRRRGSHPWPSCLLELNQLPDG